MTSPAYQINSTEDDMGEGARAADDYQEIVGLGPLKSAHHILFYLLK